jgi:hypothetical protein
MGMVYETKEKLRNNLETGYPVEFIFQRYHFHYIFQKCDPLWRNEAEVAYREKEKIWGKRKKKCPNFPSQNSCNQKLERMVYSEVPISVNFQEIVM